MAEDTKVLIKRTSKTLSDLEELESSLSWGEQLYLTTDEGNYLTIGGVTEADKKITSNTKVVKFIPQEKEDSQVFYKQVDNLSFLKNENGDTLTLSGNNVKLSDGKTLNELKYAISNSIGGAATKVATTQATNLTANYYIMGKPSSSSDDGVFIATANSGANTNKAGIRFSGDGTLKGAVYNDFAEFRRSSCDIPGTCIKEVGDGTMTITEARLEAGVSVISDTYGFIIGEEGEGFVPVCVAGRVLVKHDGSDFKAGDAVCASVDGVISKMTREEIKEWPDRIVGFVSEIPTYEE